MSSTRLPVGDGLKLQMPLTSFRDGLRTFKVIFAADQSAANGGQPVKVV